MTYAWKKKKAQADHGEDWLMTYADMITLLLCFFAVIIMSITLKKNVLVTASPAITPAAIILAPIITVDAQPPVSVEAVPSKMLAIFPGDLPFRPSASAGHQSDEDQSENTAPALPTAVDVAVDAPVAATAFLAVVDNASPPPAPVADPVVATPDTPKPTGDRITILEINSAAFFGVGSATLSKAGIVILQDVVPKLKADTYKDYQITVEGHTDDTPIHTAQFRSNWELSTARASAVVHYFLDQGISAQRLRAAGYADTFPKAPNRDAKGNPLAANRAENRRVVIELEKIEK